MATLVKTLARFGIETSAAEFEQMVAEAVEELLAEWRPLEPRANLGAAEVDELRDGGMILEQLDYGKDDPVLQSATRYSAILATSLSVGQVAEMLGVDASRIRHRLADRTIYGIRFRSGWRVPTFQFEGGRLLPGIDRVLPRLPDDMHPLEVIGWFTTPDPDLIVKGVAVSPREWLRIGRNPETLVGLATCLGNEL